MKKLMALLIPAVAAVLIPLSSSAQSICTGVFSGVGGAPSFTTASQSPESPYAVASTPRKFLSSGSIDVWSKSRGGSNPVTRIPLARHEEYLESFYDANRKELLIVTEKVQQFFDRFPGVIVTRKVHVLVGGQIRNTLVEAPEWMDQANIQDGMFVVSRFGGALLIHTKYGLLELPEQTPIQRTNADDPTSDMRFER
jgi:hypothetical protein